VIFFVILCYFYEKCAGVLYKLQYNMCPEVLRTMFHYSPSHIERCGDLCKYL